MSARLTQDAAIAPVRDAMLRQASERAGHIIGQAQAAAEATVARAREAAREAVEAARASGVEQAQPVAAAELNRGRRAARTIELAAALSAHEQIAGRIRQAVLTLRDDADYPMLRARLSARAAEAAGPGAQLTEHPLGGVIARGDGIVVDCSLPRLADRAIAALDPRITGLCFP
jgi:hypothetical protein